MEQGRIPSYPVFLREIKYMAKKKGSRILIRLQSTESGYIYYTEKNRQNDTQRLELRKYDPVVRKHVLFRETK